MMMIQGSGKMGPEWRDGGWWGPELGFWGLGSVEKDSVAKWIDTAESSLLRVVECLS